MTEIISHLMDQPIANVIALVGLFCLFLAAVGKISGKIEPDTRGRILSGVLGLILLTLGLVMHSSMDASAAKQVVPPVAADPTKTVAAPIAGTCAAGYVWRLVVPDDHVCVTRETRDQVESDNKLAPARVQNRGGYGADTCVMGFVWRDAVPQDHVCVPPETREKARNDNALSATRIAQ